MAARKKPEPTPAELSATIVNGRSLSDWEGRFHTIENGFHGAIEVANHKVGILMVRHHGEIVYIGSGTAKKQGLLARLRQVAFHNSTGSTHRGALKIRKCLDEVQLDLLMFEREKPSITTVKELTKLLLKKHAPKWNVPSKSIREIREKSVGKKTDWWSNVK